MMKVNLNNFKRAVAYNKSPVFLVETIEEWKLFTTVNGYKICHIHERIGDEEDTIFWQTQINKLEVIPAEIVKDKQSLRVVVSPDIEVKE